MRILTALCSIVGLSWFGPALAENTQPTAKPQVAKGGGEASALRIPEWFAAGSGCRASHAEPGDVRMEFVGQDPKDPDTYVIRFHLDSYQLDGKKPVRVNATFARECAMRIAAYLPEKKRVKAIQGLAAAIVDKDSVVKVRVASQFHLGPSVVAEQIDFHEPGKPLKGFVHKIDVKAAAPQLPPQKCGAPKVVGFDLSFSNWRDTLQPEVRVAMAGDKIAEMRLTLEDCVPEPETTATPSPTATPSATPTVKPVKK